jgi:hypothetical protein
MGNRVLRAAFSFFVDRAQEPSRRSVSQVLGQARPAWDNLEMYLAESYDLEGSLHFMYGEKYGWALRFRRGGRTILTMYPNRGFFTVQIILSKVQVAAARAIGLPSRVLKVLDGAKDYPEGRWLFIPVESRKAVRELRTLIGLKLPRPKRVRVSGEAQGEEPIRRTSGCS